MWVEVLENHQLGVLLLGDVVSNKDSFELVGPYSSLGSPVGRFDLRPLCLRGILFAVADDDIDEFPAIGAA